MKLVKSKANGRFPRVSRALDTSGWRPVLGGAMLKVEEVPGGQAGWKRAVLYATNSYFFVRHVLTAGTPADIEEIVEGPIPKIALMHMEKGVEFHADEDGIRAGLARYDRKLAEGTTGKESFPDFASLRPPKPKRAFRVSLNAGLMDDLAASLGSDQLVFEFDMDQFTSGPRERKDSLTYLRAIRVTVPGGSESEAILMPIRLN